MPVHVNACTVGAFEALLWNVRVALAVPTLPGVHVTVKFAELPAAIVCGSEIPEIVNSPLSILAEETVTAAPVALSVPLSEELVPTTMVPKSRLGGATDNCPGWVPVPVMPIFRGEFEASETIARLPLALPAAAGANFAVKVTL